MNRDTAIAALRARIDAAMGPLFQGGSFALLDFPDHSNVGDSAIWLGETAWFAQHRGAVRLTAAKELPAVQALQESGPIFIHGGGNFGTLWPAHQRLRIDVLNAARGVPVIQLPQSIHFDSEADVAETARAIAAHGRFTLMVRDRPSLAFAQKHFECETLLVPDMAFYMGALDRCEPDVDRYYLLRTDLEKVDSFSPDMIVGDAVCEDWLEEGPGLRSVKLAAALMPPWSGTAERKYRIFNTLAEHRVRRGCKALSRGRVVVTDRLHGHILCVLLGIPHVVLDNSYRKIGNFVDAWTADVDYMRTASSMEEAAAMAEELQATVRVEAEATLSS